MEWHRRRARSLQQRGGLSSRRLVEEQQQEGPTGPAGPVLASPVASDTGSRRRPLHPHRHTAANPSCHADSHPRCFADPGVLQESASKDLLLAIAMITVAQTSGCHHHATPSQPVAAGQVLEVEGLVELAVDPVPDAPQPREVVTALFGRGHVLIVPWARETSRPTESPVRRRIASCIELIRANGGASFGKPPARSTSK